MRNREVIKCYIVSEKKFDNAYFVYSFDGNIVDVYSYATRDIAVFQLK